MQMVKGISARKINQEMQRTGKLWANDYYDRLIRNEKHFDVVYRYLKRNPLVLKEKSIVPRFYGIYE